MSKIPSQLYYSAADLLCAQKLQPSNFNLGGSYYSPIVWKAGLLILYHFAIKLLGKADSPLALN